MRSAITVHIYYHIYYPTIGLATACYMFTKLMRSLVKHWCSSGLKVIVYLNDGIVAGQGETDTVNERMRVQQELSSAGFIVNEKSHNGSNYNVLSGWGL